MKQTDGHTYTNRLVNQSSPYLLQHAHNPVDWYPWGEEALEKAKDENKLMIISIGYAACHWCHVMEHESFEDSTVAEIMNKNFISIKVDREERPDVDQIYQGAAELLTGRGGWPLNAIALPDGRPIFAGTYFPKENWLNLLHKIQDVYIKSPDKVNEQAEKITEGINTIGLVPMIKEEQTYSLDDLKAVFSNWEPIIDYELGGQKRAPKFPMPVGQEFLLKYAFLTGDESAKKAVLLTLDKIASGGIYDQIGGGFARYSTDIYWKVPHFEKMLYDNAQLVTLYSHAFQMTKKPLYKQVVYETLGFVERELTASSGAFYTSLDADSEGEEGKFYIWQKSEIDAVLGDNAEVFNAYYSVEEEGNWEEGKNILLKTKTDSEIAEKFGITIEELHKQLTVSRKKLFEVRDKREKPPLDDKSLTSLNALMLKGYVDAYRAFNEKEFLDKAKSNAALILNHVLQDDYRLMRNFKDGKVSINGFLEDYAFTIDAFISLYQATFDEEWLFKAEKLLDYTLVHFYNPENGMFYYTSDLDPALVARKTEVPDNVIPSSNSVMAKNLYILGQYLYKPEWVEKAEQMLNNVKESLVEGGPYYANWSVLMSWMITQPYEVAIVGNNFENIRKEFDQSYLPNVFFMGGKDEGKLPLLENKLVDGKTTIYVCQDKSCRLPVTETALAIKQLMP
ncbi:thioredoxin domain-containing protein [Fulvivirgaceae bacterium BMA12]|uniref:Thioredoxin domain-containing protein n=1 Tax=Agaribacillus aureus TaxID=3051825 RepID=A0ABT8L3C0_9BACT|nr:thioredoxin domain-containing protein [Fulvivirgaceae bacterium BMA12]